MMAMINPPLKSQTRGRQLTHKIRYGFLKLQIKLKYRNRDNLNAREQKRVQRRNARRNLEYKAYTMEEKKKDTVFTFRKGSYPIRASFTPIAKPIYDRSKIITEKYRNRMVSVFNGMLYFNYKIPDKAIGSKFGELAPSKQWKVGTTHSKRKKSKKIPNSTKGGGGIKKGGAAAKSASAKKSKK